MMETGSNIKFNINNFKIIDKALVEPEGITLVAGENLQGKSTILKAIKAVLDNGTSDNSYRHGTSELSVAITLDDKNLTFKRTKADGVSVEYGGKIYRKIGKTSLNQVVPTFPLRRVDYTDNIFYPNFVFQNGTPIFDDISVYDLFSALFSDISKISERVGGLRKDVLTVKKSYGDIEVLLKNAQENRLNALNELDVFHAENRKLETKYNSSLITRKEEVEYQSQIDRLSKLRTVTQDSAKKRAVLALGHKLKTIENDCIKTAKAVELEGYVDKLKNEVEELNGILTAFVGITTNFFKNTNNSINNNNNKYNQYNNINQYINKYKYNINNKNKYKNIEKKIDIVSTLSPYNKFNNFIDYYRDIKSLSFSLLKREDEIKHTGDSIAVLKEQVSKFKVCPTCNRLLSGTGKDINTEGGNE